MNTRHNPQTVANDATPIFGGETSLADLNRTYALLCAPGSASCYISVADGLPISDNDLNRRLAPYHVVEGSRKVPAFKYWTQHPLRRVYTKIVFTGKQTAPDAYNLYRGLGVTPKAGVIDKIQSHVIDVICSGNGRTANKLFDLMAWQIQNIGKPSRVIVLLKTAEQQSGKGIFIAELLSRIYGPSSFTPSNMGQVVGRFNASLRGKSFVFLDEILFGGDKRSADALKSLSTATEIGLEEKGLPIVNGPVGMNFWMASNHKNAAHIEEHDARYWILNVSPHKIGDKAYFDALLHEIENGGREAFAHFLLSRDIGNFSPAHDCPKDNDAKKEMKMQSVNPYDARKWLIECIECQEIIGLKVGNGEEYYGWVEGTRFSYAQLFRAYVDWQKHVRAPVKPEPTANLGEVLNLVGIEQKKSNGEKYRIIPAREVVAQALNVRLDD